MNNRLHLNQLVWQRARRRLALILSVSMYVAGFFALCFLLSHIHLK